METVQSQDGTSIAFDRVGVGPALIVVNGALSDRKSGQVLAERLAPRYAVYLYDRRGRGASGDTPPYAVAREVDDLAAVLGAAGGTAYVFGHSSGAVLALEAARTLRFIKLALYEPPVIVDHTREMLPADYLPHLTALLAAGQRGEAVQYFMRAAVGMPEAAVTHMSQPSPGWTQTQAMAHTLLYDNAVMGDTMRGQPEPLQHWAGVTVPTLVMDGGASPEWARNSVRALAAVLPHAQQQTLPGQTHGADPQVLVPVLEAFFGA